MVFAVIAIIIITALVFKAIDASRHRADRKARDEKRKDATAWMIAPGSQACRHCQHAPVAREAATCPYCGGGRPGYWWTCSKCGFGNEHTAACSPNAGVYCVCSECRVCGAHTHEGVWTAIPETVGATTAPQPTTPLAEAQDKQACSVCAYPLSYTGEWRGGRRCPQCGHEV